MDEQLIPVPRRGCWPRRVTLILEHLTIGVLVSFGSCSCNDRPVGDDDGIPTAVRRYAAARCKVLDACDCRSTTHADRQECEADMIQLYEDIAADGTPIELSCFDRGTEFWKDISCATQIRGLPPLCNLVPDTGRQGDPCSDPLGTIVDPFVITQYCAEGFFCWGGECVEGLEARAEGEPCSPEGLCGHRDLSCIADRCEQRRADGEACEHWHNCLSGLTCRDGICGPEQPEGSPCGEDQSCDGAGLLCTDGRCNSPTSSVCYSRDFPLES